MLKIKGIHLIYLSLLMVRPLLYGQGQQNFLGHWTGSEDLSTQSVEYLNRNISIQIDEGGDREGFCTFTSSCEFLYNEELDWTYHYFNYDKESSDITFLKRFITPIGVLGYEELNYDLIEWSDDGYFIAEYRGNGEDTYHQIRMSTEMLGNTLPVQSNVLINDNFPNPFNPFTTISVFVDTESEGLLSIIDINGRTVRTLKQGRFDVGNIMLTWNGLDDKGVAVSSGTYFCSMIINGNRIHSKRMTLLK